MNVWEKIMRGLSAFREAYVDSTEENQYVFESIEARQLRYSLYWSYYSNTAYSRVHNWATSYKSDQNLYKYIRNIFSPAYRIGEFYRQHIWGGSLDISDIEKGALPIETENENVLIGVSKLWRDSNMQILKDIITLHGAIEGDVFIKVNDDPERRQVTLERVPAYTIVDLDLDSMGNIKGYVLEENRVYEGRDVTYKEVVGRDGEYVTYQTFKDKTPFGWYGQPEEWAIPYGFVPLVHIQHNNVGLDFGWSELHPIRGKVQELDEQASLLSDYLRKYSDPVWLATGKRMGNIALDNNDDDGTDDSKPGRNRLKIISGFASDSKVTPLVTDMKVADTLKYINTLQEEVERDFPELQTDIWATGATSGRALRIARERVESKVLQRRVNYDDGLVRAQMMALSIGGYRNYPEYTAFDINGIDKKYHRISNRPVFALDPMDTSEIDQATWSAIKTAVDAGAPLKWVLKDKGFSEEAIKELTEDIRV